MKKVITLLSFLLVVAFATAQDNYEAGNEGWLVNLDEAYALSKETGKPIMANFTGSDWCGWCRKLTADVFSKPGFKDWAEDNVILLELDFPRRKTLPDDIRQQNSSLQQAFKVRGFPTVWVFNINKEDNQFSIEALGKTGYTPSLDQFTSDVDMMIERGKDNK